MPDADPGGLAYLTFPLRSMGRGLRCALFTPPGYGHGEGRHPVVDFLHGAGEDERTHAGPISDLFRRGIEARAIPPILAAFPEGGQGGYIDRPERGEMAETAIVGELVPAIDGAYRTLAAPGCRAVCGFSMGGGGAVRLALKHPDVFGTAVSWGGGLLNPGRPGEVEHDPVYLAGVNRERLRGRMRLQLIVGRRDFARPAHGPFVSALGSLGLEFDYRVLPGVSHDAAAYREEAGETLLRFLNDGLSRAIGPGGGRIADPTGA